jgi:hypothetical protein
MFAAERVARVLPRTMASIDMFRATVLSIALTLAVGPTASLLCGVWCHSDASTGSCEHRDPTSTPSVTAKDGCPDVAADAAALVREEVRRGVSASDGQYAVVGASAHFVPPPAPPQVRRESGQQVLPETKPLLLALRI